METLTEGSEEKRDETCARAVAARRTPQKRELAKKWMDVRD